MIYSVEVLERPRSLVRTLSLRPKRNLETATVERGLRGHLIDHGRVFEGQPKARVCGLGQRQILSRSID